MVTVTNLASHSIITFELLRQKLKVKSLSRVRLFATPWAIAYETPPSMEFSRLEWVAISFSRGAS